MSVSEQLIAGSHLVHTAGRPSHAGVAVAASAGIAARAAVAARASTAARAGAASRASTASRAGTASRASVASKASSTRGAKGVSVRQSRIARPRTQQVELRASAHSSGEVRVGDQSRTWQFPGRQFTDQFSTNGVARIAVASPFIATAATDGAYLRASVGSLSWLLTVLAIAIATIGGVAANGVIAALPLGAFAAVMVIGLFDALAGVAAVVTVMGISLVNGTLFDATGLTALVILAAVWCGLSVIVGKVRPFVRLAPATRDQWWERTGDLVLGSLLAGFLAEKFTGILPTPSHITNSLSAHATSIGIIAVAATAVKYMVCTLVSKFYPARLDSVTNDELPPPHAGVRTFGLVVRAAAAFVIFGTFLGYNVAVAFLVALYIVDLWLPPKIRPRKVSGWARFVIPTNIGKILFLTIAGVAAEHLLRPYVAGEYALVIATLLLVMVLALCCSFLGMLEPGEHPHRGLARAAGALLALTAILQLSGHLFN